MASKVKKSSLKDRLKARKEELKRRGKNTGVVYLKEGTLRVRPLPVGEEQEFVHEVMQFYLGAEIKGVFSNSTFDEPCPIMEKYEDYRSGDEDDKEIAKKFSPKRKYLMPCLIYEDTKGKKIDEDKGIQLVQITGGLYEEIIDLYLDEEFGDMTDPSMGYDLKLKREGSGMTDTSYSLVRCNTSKIPKKYHKEVDLEEMVRAVIPPYDEAKQKISQFLGESYDEDEEDTSTKKKKKKKMGTKKKSSSKKKKKRA